MRIVQIWISKKKLCWLIPNEEALPLVLVLGDISAYICALQIGGWAWGNHRLCTRFEPNSWLLLMKASSRWPGVTRGDANYWCLCPSGKERGLTVLKCSFLLHFGAESLFFKNSKQCLCITGKLHVSVSNVMPRLPISWGWWHAKEDHVTFWTLQHRRLAWFLSVSIWKAIQNNMLNLLKKTKGETSYRGSEPIIHITCFTSNVFSSICYSEK